MCSRARKVKSIQGLGSHIGTELHGCVITTISGQSLSRRILPFVDPQNTSKIGKRTRRSRLTEQRLLGVPFSITLPSGGFAINNPDSRLFNEAFSHTRSFSSFCPFHSETPPFRDTNVFLSRHFGVTNLRLFYSTLRLLLRPLWLWHCRHPSCLQPFFQTAYHSPPLSSRSRTLMHQSSVRDTSLDHVTPSYSSASSLFAKTLYLNRLRKTTETYHASPVMSGVAWLNSNDIPGRR